MRKSRYKTIGASLLCDAPPRYANRESQPMRTATKIHFCEVKMFLQKQARRKRTGILLAAAFAGILPLAAAQNTSPTSSSSTDSGAASGCDLIVHVDGLRNARGKVGTTVFRSPAGWPENNSKALRHGQSPIVMTPQGPQSTMTWKDLPPGDYTVAAIYDENESHKLDRNFFGLPIEGFGFANNPPVGLSAPSFRKALVHLACPSTEVRIHIQYR